ncbi:hypothetical protein HBI24_250520 [Parastagonospora nodorum]|nr:hypothetical protein HBI24_250520 [Parastagonospora nodorum]
MTDSLRARTPINLSTVLYEQSAARPSLSAEVSNIDLNFVPGVAFIPNVYIADSLRARTLINLSAVLYEQAAAQTGLPAEVSNIDFDFVLSVAFIPNVYIADSLRARTPINLSAVLYDLRARTLINLSAVLYEQVSIMDLDFVPSVAFDAIRNVELTGDLLGNADRVNNNNNNVALTLQFSPTALLNLRLLASKRPALSSSDLNRRRTNPTIATLLAKRIKTDENRNDNNVQLVRDNIEELICVTRNNRNNLNIIVTNPTGREFGRVDMKSLTRLCLLIDRAKAYNISKFYKGKNIQLLRPFTQQGLTPREPGSIYILRIVSKLDKVPTREPSSHIKTELYLHQKQALYFMLRDNSRKFYHLIITGKDTHYKQTIKKAYIMLPERALLILFIT